MQQLCRVRQEGNHQCEPEALQREKINEDACVQVSCAKPNDVELMLIAISPRWYDIL